MPVIPPGFPPLILIPAGCSPDGIKIAPFWIGQGPVTNEEYGRHLDQHQETPFVLMEAPSLAGATSVVTRQKRLEDIPILDAIDVSPSERERLAARDLGKPLLLGAFVLFELKEEDFSDLTADSQKPVTNMSWFHAMDYCLDYGFRLPTDEEWDYAAARPEGLYLASGGWQWTACNPKEGSRYALRGNEKHSPELRFGRRPESPYYRSPATGFRVARSLGFFYQGAS